MVTTNFDRHFSTPADDLFAGQPVEHFFAPALPLGHRFAGIVHLHGSVRPASSDLVLTDEDFGRAYLTEGWARRFLRAMFDQYTILFVGYSHDDLVMTYLARGLPPDPSPRRFVLTGRADDPRWHFLGILPISYPLTPEPDRHRSLEVAVARWAERSRLGFLDHDQQIRAVVQGSPPLDREPADYIAHILTDPSTARIFVRHAEAPDWLRWVEGQGFLRPLFGLATRVEESAEILADWIASNFVTTHPEAGLSLIQRNGLQLNPVLWNAVGFHLWKHRPEISSDIFSRWVSILLSAVPTTTRHPQILDYLLNKCQLPDDVLVAVSLFAFLTTPRLSLRPPLVFPDAESEEKPTPDAEVLIDADEYWLKTSWSTVLRPHLPNLAHPLYPIVTGNLRMAHLLLKTWGHAHDDWDPLSLRRAAIEPHEQDRYPHAFDVLIDAARDLVDWMLVNAPALAKGLTHDWVSSGVPLLVRTAIHAVDEDPSLNADQKLAWTLERRLLYRYGFTHEVLRLLGRAYPSASSEARRLLLSDVAQGPPGVPPGSPITDEERDHEVYRILVWLHQTAPDCTLLGEHIAAIRARRPDIQAPEHPDLERWTMEGPVTPRSPYTVDTLLAREDPATILDELLTYRDDSLPDRLAREGMLGVIASAVTRSRPWGWQLIGTLRARDLWTSDVWGAILRGWRDAFLDEQEWAPILALLLGERRLHAYFRSIADLLLVGVTRETNRIPVACLSRAQDLAEAIWPVSSTSPAQGTDWSHLAINHPGGRLVEFWLHALALQRRELNVWTGLPEGSRNFFDRILNDDTTGGALGRVLLVGQLHFLFTLDAPWAETHLLPLLDWTGNQERAAQGWHGFLTLGRWNTALLGRLMPLYEQTFTHLGALGDLSERFAGHLASIVVFGDRRPNEEGWVRRYLERGGDQDRRDFAGNIRHLLRSMSDDAKAGLWRNWMNEYWAERLRGRPPLSAGDAEVMADWLVLLGPVFSSAVDRFCEGPAPPLRHTGLYSDLRENALATRHPGSVAQLLGHILPAAAQPFFHCDDSIELVRALVAADIDRDTVRQLCNELVRLGCQEAAELARGLHP